MPDPPRQDCVHPDVGAYALGLLEPDELAAYERHLLRCARCNRLLAELGPLVEMLDRVDAPNLLAATGMGPPLPRPPGPGTPPVVTGPLKMNGHARRLTLTAAATAVLVLVGFVTFVARSSEQSPFFTAGEPATAVATTPPGAEPALEPERTRDRSAAGASPAPPHTSNPTPVRPGRTRPGSPPAEGEPGPDIMVGPGPPGPLDGAEPSGGPRRYAGKDPSTGVSATVDVTGADLALTLAGVGGACDCALVVHGPSGLKETVLRWRLPPGGAPYTATATTVLDPIDHFEVVDAAGTVIVTVSAS